MNKQGPFNSCAEALRALIETVGELGHRWEEGDLAAAVREAVAAAEAAAPFAEVIDIPR